jgi:hypothetical protein
VDPNATTQARRSYLYQFPSQIIVFCGFCTRVSSIPPIAMV